MVVSLSPDIPPRFIGVGIECSGQLTMRLLETYHLQRYGHLEISFCP
jgi:hypothetical protein